MLHRKGVHRLKGVLKFDGLCALYIYILYNFHKMHRCDTLNDVPSHLDFLPRHDSQMRYEEVR